VDDRDELGRRLRLPPETRKVPLEKGRQIYAALFLIGWAAEGVILWAITRGPIEW